MSYTIGLNNARKLCNCIAYILDLSEEIVQYTKPEFHSKYPHMKKLGVASLNGSRSANCINSFVVFKCENIRELDKLFKRLYKISDNRITVIVQEGDTGLYFSRDNYFERM